MHTRWMFRHVHGVHHRSREPSPWAAYAMHPVEAMVNGWSCCPLLVVPVQEHVLGLFVLHQVLRNVHGHAAVESLPRGFARHWFWRPVHHHHAPPPAPRDGPGQLRAVVHVVGSLFGTERADYLQRFDKATSAEAATVDCRSGVPARA